MTNQPAITRIRKIENDLMQCLYLSKFDKLVIDCVFERHIREFEEEVGR
jgi:hypothetical protein